MSARVATTQWSQILAAKDGTDSEARRALELLCQTYWQPLYAYVRAQGNDPEEASDLTQAYFAELLEKDFLAQVDPAKGRFRAFLLASMRNFLSHERDRERALKRGGGTLTLSLDIEAGERNYAATPVEEETPEAVFDRRWAMTVLDRALDRLGAGEDERQFEQFKPFLTSAGQQTPYRQVAKTLGMSEGAIKTAVHRLRKRFGECLRAEIAETVADPVEVDDEVRHLLAVVRRQ